MDSALSCLFSVADEKKLDFKGVVLMELSMLYHYIGILFPLFCVCTRGISGTEFDQCLIIGELYVRRGCLELFLSGSRQYCCRLSVSGFLRLVLPVAGLMGQFFVMGSSFVV